MTHLLALLASAHAWAAPPQLACTPLEVPIEAEAEEVAKARPRGFQWEGLQTTAVLEDGRMVLVRHAALEDLSRRDLKRQHTKRSPDRVSQVFVITPEAELEAQLTVPRGTLLELIALPGGGMALARTNNAITVVDHIDDKGAFTGSVAMAENPQADKLWRDENPLRASGPARLTAAGTDRVVSWHAGAAQAFDLSSHTRVSSESLYPLGIYTLRGRRDRASELLLVDRNRRVMWLDADLNLLRTRECNACRVVGHDKPVDLDKAEGSWLPAVRQRGAAIGERYDGGLRIGFLGLSQRDKEPDPVLLPVQVEGAWTWRLREGPWGTALVSVSQRGGSHTVRAVQPGHADPVWSWTAPADLVRDGEDIVADALGPYVRIRVAKGQGLEEETRLSLLVDPRTGAASSPVRPDSVQQPLREALSSPWVSRHFAGDVLLRELTDPMSVRSQPGAGLARFERCRVRLSP